MLQEQGDEWQKLHLRRSDVVRVLVRWFVRTCFSHSRGWSRRPISRTFLVRKKERERERERTRLSNCHMTNGHVIVGSSVHESQEKESITFCSQQILSSWTCPWPAQDHCQGCNARDILIVKSHQKKINYMDGTTCRYKVSSLQMKEKNLSERKKNKFLPKSAI